MGKCSEASSAACVLSATLFKGIDSVTVKRGWAVVFDDQVMLRITIQRMHYANKRLLLRLIGAVLSNAVD